MKILLFGKNIKKIEKIALNEGFKIVKSKPNFILSCGGDGTFMISENKFPDIPKVLLKESEICKKCTPNLSHQEILQRVKSGRYLIEKLEKLEVNALGKTMYAINDIVIHNYNPRHAIRYDLSIDKKFAGENIIGDGIVVSSPFGSSGYYKSITDSIFEIGIGLAFNNSTEQSDHMVINPKREIKFTLKRGPAEVYADNSKEKIKIKSGNEVLIKQSNKIAKIVRPLEI